MDTEAIVFDLDDTLLNTRAQISDFTVETLDACRARGIRIIPASGRAIHSMRPYVERIHNDKPFIACNGAQVAGTDFAPIESLELSNALILELWDYVRSEGVYLQVYDGDVFYFEQACRQSAFYERSSGMRGVAVGDIHKFLTIGSPKILCCDEPERIQALYEKTLPLFGDRVTATISKPIFMEIAPLGATKGAALERLSKREGFDLRKTMAFGDSLNDVSMFTVAGHSVAMGNARAETKQAASAVTLDNDHDGVAGYIRKHVLGGKA